MNNTASKLELELELELELIQIDMTQKPMLRVEVGAVPCSRCACVAHKGHARKNRGRGQAARKLGPITHASSGHLNSGPRRCYSACWRRWWAVDGPAGDKRVAEEDQL